MFLKEIENRPPEGVMKIAFNKMDEAGQEIPGIMHLFRFKKHSTDHLVRFTEEVMRGPSPLSPGMRELIGAFVSTRNQCSFCSCAHAPVAARLLGQELVDEVLNDFETSRLDRPHKELFRYVAKLTASPATVGASDVKALKEAGWGEEAIYDALTVAAVFKFYNTWNNGAGVQTMSRAAFVHSSNRLLTMGYCMDFGLKAFLKVLWVGRKEIKFGDLVELAKIILKKIARVVSVGGKDRSIPLIPQTSCGLRAPVRAQEPAGSQSGVYKEEPVGVSLVESGDPAA